MVGTDSRADGGIFLRNISVDEFDAVYDIMENSFPDDEYRSYCGQKMLFSKPEYDIYVVDGDDSTIRAFVSVWDFDNFAYIEHLAVNPAFRNAGIGASILAAVKEKAGKRICLEVELPENDIARRRIGFYTRNGFSLNEYHYIQPPMSAGKNPVPLLIMTTGGAVDEKKFEYIKDKLYEKVYNVHQ